MGSSISGTIADIFLQKVEREIVQKKEDIFLEKIRR